jgi:hypothetical protein
MRTLRFYSYGHRRLKLSTGINGLESLGVLEYLNILLDSTGRKISHAVGRVIGGLRDNDGILRNFENAALPGSFSLH